MNLKLRESVTAVFQSGDRFLLLERAHHLRAFPGFTSFVGGKVDQEDSEGSPLAYPNSTGLDDRFLRAINREVKEEVGYDLEVNSENINEVNFLGIATTPAFQKIRFQNYYILFKLKESFETIDDDGEIRSSSWTTLDEFFKQDDLGHHMMVPPSRNVLRWLKEGKLPQKEPAELDLVISEDKVPEIEFVTGISILMPLSNTFPPAYRTNCFYFGEPAILIDPSPKNEDEYKKLMNTIGKRQVDMVFLTHHHPDHHEFAPQIARDLNVPILMSSLTNALIVAKYGADYFDGCDVQFIEDGDVLCSWHGHKIKVLATPGHASGQLTLVSENNQIAIVNDLIQTVGTVVVAPPNGNMKDYFQSLQLMIDRKDNFIFPSHGLPLGGVHKLQKTLEHRQQREDGIKELLAEGKSFDEIISIIYADLDERLLPYAQGTLKAHLEKIEEDSTSS
jgi:ribonuclease/clavin/mitogillin